MSLTKAQEDRVRDLSTYTSRLAHVLGENPVDVLDALALCSLTLTPDKHDVVQTHKEVIQWVPWKGTAT
jgi:hypothetical protein